MSGRSGWRGSRRRDRRKVGGESVEGKVRSIVELSRLCLNPGGRLGIEAMVMARRMDAGLALRTSSANFASTALGFLASRSLKPLDSLPVSEEESNLSSSSSSSLLSLSLSDVLLLPLDSAWDSIRRWEPFNFLQTGDLAALRANASSSSSDELSGMSGRAYSSFTWSDFGFGAVVSVQLGYINEHQCCGRSVTYPQTSLLMLNAYAWFFAK